MKGAGAAVSAGPAPRACFFGCAGPVLGRDEAAFFRDADPLGFILFARNVRTPEQVHRLTADLRAALGREAMVMVDQEGGRVARLGAPHWRRWPPPLDQVRRAGPEAAPRAMYLRYRLIAEELAPLGIDVDCAPVADIATPLTHPFLHNRCLGETASEVAAAAAAAAAGLLDGGVLPVVKHLPGHGRARADSHHELPVVEAPEAELARADFAPFRALAGLPLAMTAHIRFTAIDPERPATLSSAVLARLRGEIGFQGLLMTDDISMGALAKAGFGGAAHASEAALAAGCDAVLHCNGDAAEMVQVAAACRPLDAAGQARAAAALDARRPPDAASVTALAAELDALTGEAAHGA